MMFKNRVSYYNKDVHNHHRHHHRRDILNLKVSSIEFNVHYHIQQIYKNSFESYQVTS